jgi:hypothetical protein
MGFIDAPRLHRLVSEYGDSLYGQYLRSLLADDGSR